MAVTPQGALGLAALVGNRAFGAIVAGLVAGEPRLMRKPRGQMTPGEIDADDELKREFAGKTFTKATHEPAIGGRFGISYRPGAGSLAVTVRILFDFQDFPKELASKDERPYCEWKQEEKARWTREFCARVADRWSGQHTIRCTKDGWEEFSVTPVVRVEPAIGEAAHYTVRIHKDMGGKRVQAGVDRVTKEADFSESNIQAEQDVASGEAKTKEAEILERERTRLSGALAGLGGGGANPITFPPGGIDVPVPARPKLWEFGRALAAALPSAPRLPVQVVGESKDEGERAASLAEARANLVGTIINGTAGGYPLRVSTRPDGGGRRATVALGEPEEGWANRYSVAEHEFGHMLGNPDEYHDPLHPHDEAKRNAWMALVKSAGVSVPMGGEEASTSSQMSKGTDVLPAHYATIWEALGELTSPYVKREEWTLST